MAETKSETKSMAGYSGTPLSKKLGIKENFKLAILNQPDGFMAELVDLPEGVELDSKGRTKMNMILCFVDSATKLKRLFPRMATQIVPNGMIWIAWPKKSSGVETDLSFDVVQRTGLDAGLVDTKICAINDTWSGLKFMIRVKDR
jgi:hypothetical protein